MKLLYKPFSIIAGIVGTRAGRKAFTALWSGISDSPKPSPKAPDTTVVKVTLAAALEGATLAAAGALTSHLAARLFHHLFGVWPEEQRDRAGADIG